MELLRVILHLYNIHSKGLHASGFIFDLRRKTKYCVMCLDQFQGSKQNE